MNPLMLKLCLSLQGIDSAVIGDETSLALALKLNETVARKAGACLKFESNPATFLRLLQDPEKDFRTA